MTPTPTEREGALVSAFVRLADTLITDYDAAELLHMLCADCVEVLHVDAAGLLLGDQRGSLRLVSASTEAAQLLEQFQLQSDQGPLSDCYTTGGQVHVGVLAHETRWPRFVTRARDHGFATVHAVPLRLRGQTIGALNLFHGRAGGMPTGDLAIAQALADVATIAVLSPDCAGPPGAARLRTHARRARRRLSELADSVVDGTLDTTVLLS